MKTDSPPKDKPLMVFDGDCGFCRYWLVKWKKLSKDHYDYAPFQSAANEFQDIPLREFQKAVQLIFPNGDVISGAAVAYYPYYEFGSPKYLYKWYHAGGLFKSLSDLLYRLVARKRNFFFKVSKVCFGKDPYQNGSRIFLTRMSLILLFSLAVFYLTNIALQ